MLEWDHPDRQYLVKYCPDREEFMNSHLLDVAFQLYTYHGSCTRAERIIREIVNDAKQIYLENEEND